MLLEGAHGPVRGLAEDAVHRDGGNGVHKFGHGVEPELDLFHIVAAAAHTQQGAGHWPATRLPVAASPSLESSASFLTAT